MNSELKEFLDSIQSIQINSLDEKELPFSSYAPFIRVENRYYIYISDMAKHAHNLRRNPKCSIFFVEDESKCENIFARTRVMMQCDAKEIEKEKQDEILEHFDKKFDSKMVAMLKGLSDFNVFEFTPFYGEAVFGFAKAYNLGGENLDQLENRNSSKGHGHGSK